MYKLFVIFKTLLNDPAADWFLISLTVFVNMYNDNGMSWSIYKQLLSQRVIVEQKEYSNFTRCFAVSFIIFTVFPKKKTFRIMIAGWIFNMLKG